MFYNFITNAVQDNSSLHNKTEKHYRILSGSSTNIVCTTTEVIWFWFYLVRKCKFQINIENNAKIVLLRQIFWT